MSSRRERELAVLIVSYRRADLLDRALASVEKYLPECPVHVWDNRSEASAEVASLAAERPGVVWTFSESDVGTAAARNRLAAQAPECDALHLDPAPNCSARSPRPAPPSPSPGSRRCPRPWRTRRATTNAGTSRTARRVSSARSWTPPAGPTGCAGGRWSAA